MGQFSWMFADRNNKEALCCDEAAYVPTPDGRILFEECYDGYGRFAGQDIFVMVADWNREYLSKHPEYTIPRGCPIFVDGKWVDPKPIRVDAYAWYKAYSDLSLSHEEVVKRSGIDEYRHIGIDISCYDNQNRKLPFPIKICKCCPFTGDYERLPASDGDPNQGWGKDEEG